MKKIVLPAVMMIAISIITLGTIIGASSEVKDPTTVITNNPVEQAAGAGEAVAPVVKMVQLTPTNSAGNYRASAVAEDSKGNRLAIFRNTTGKQYSYTYCPEGGTWSAVKVIPGDQPALLRTGVANIVVDSKDRFHCTWEEAKAPVYASFFNGNWTNPAKMRVTGKFDIYSSLAIRSNDDLVFTGTEIINKNKEIHIHVKAHNESSFGKPFNLTRDKTASAESWVAVDSKDNSWVVWKSDYYLADPKVENLVTYLGMFKKDNSDGPIEWMVVTPNPGWSFFGQVAVNNEDKVMTLSSWSKGTQYISALYDQTTKKLGPLTSLGIGLCKKPWHSFYSRLVAHGKDFYAAVMNAERILLLMKYDEATGLWGTVAQVSNVNVEMFDLYSGYDQMILTWNTNREPSAIFFATVNVDPYRKIFIKSVNNLQVAKITERSFFHKYTLNSLTWEANPENIEKGIVVTAQRIYRKGRSEDKSKWLRIAQVSPTVFAYADNPVAEDSDYVYAVTVVDDKEHESVID